MGGARRQRRAAIGRAIPHVDFVDELVYHDVMALLGQPARGGYVLPAQRHRPALHRLAQQRFLVLMHHAGGIALFAPRQHRARMHDDPGEIVIPGKPQAQHRQAGLRGDGDGHFIGHHKPVRAGKFLVLQKPAGQGAQLLLVASRPRGQKGMVLQGRAPQRFRNGFGLAGP